MWRAAAILSALVLGVAAASAQNVMSPLPPPVAAPPLPATGSTISPLLTQPGPVIAAPSRPLPTYPATPSPGPLDQQKSLSYRNDLSNRLRQLDSQGVSPGNEQYRQLQQQLNRPGG